MNRGNASMNGYALQQLELAPHDRVLEIGFGGGLILARLLAEAGVVTGLDRSADAVQAACAKFANDVRAKRAVFVEGNIERMPFVDGSFDKVVTVNTVYFWASLADGFSEIHRVLAPEGRLIVGFLPKDRMDRLAMPADIFTSRSPDDLLSAAGSAGFGSVEISRPDPSTPWALLVARK